MVLSRRVAITSYEGGELVRTGFWCERHRQPMLRLPDEVRTSASPEGVCLSCCVRQASKMPGETKRYYAALLRWGMGAATYAELAETVETSDTSIPDEDRVIIAVHIQSAMSGISIQHGVAEFLVREAAARGTHD